MIGVPPGCVLYPHSSIGESSLSNIISKVCPTDSLSSLHIPRYVERHARREIHRARARRQLRERHINWPLTIMQGEGEVVDRVRLAGIAEAPDEVRLRLGGGADARRRQRAILFLIANGVRPAAEQYTSDYKQRSKKIRGKPHGAGGTISN